jgi:hypothetical protein
MASLRPQRHLHLARQGFELFNERPLLLPVHAVAPREREGEQAQGDQLGGEGLGGGHADLGAGAGHHRHVGFPHQRAFRHVADAQAAQVAHLLRGTQGGEGVGGLAGLGDGDEQRVGRDHDLPVAELAGHLHVARHARLLQPVAGDEAGVVAGATGDDVHALRGVQQTLRLVAEAFLQQPALVDPALERFGDHAGLLEDLLEHVVPVGSLLRRGHRELGFAHRAFRGIAFGVQDPHGVAADLGDVALLQEDEALGDWQQGEDVGGDEVLAHADADDQRAAQPRDDQPVGLVGAGDSQGKGTHHLLRGGLHGGEQVGRFFQVACEQVGDDLGIGFRGEAVAGLAEFCAQLGVVLDDAVVHHRHALAAHVGMGVALGGDAVGGPAGVGDAKAAGERFGIQTRLQFAHLAHRADALDVTVVHAHGDAGGVVAPVLQAPQALHQDRDDVAFSDGSDNSAHG